MTDKAANAAATVHADFGNLGSFTRTGFTGNNNNLMVFDRFTDIIHTIRNRQSGRKTGWFMEGLALPYLLLATFKPGCYSFQIFLAGFPPGSCHQFCDTGSFLL